MIGFGLLFATGFWWPGLLILCGVTAMVEGVSHGQGWYGIQGGLWLIVFAIWAMFGYSIALLFVGLGVSAIASAFVRPNFMAKPQVDNTLE